MGIERKAPGDVARRLGERRDRAPADVRGGSGAWRRDTFTLPRDQAREMARS